ncbi:MAG: FAD-dependent oxidoreductase [Halieaceae bacterium]|jgi:2,4-dienoyl-CoA reductase-like NADH-dependent reductase (Old Yellow Enzyme family)|nr:FAD-dependent oxidoreductase [Halieaceae bacterium]
MSLKYLFTPHEIRDLEIRNRIYSTAHQTILAERGAPGDKMAAYHEARAQGGAGLIIMESSRPYSDDVSASYYLDSSTDNCIPGYKLVAERVHKHGCKLFAQINHGGRIAYSHDGLRMVPNGPSLVPDHRFHCMPRVMSTDYIQNLVQAFSQAARRMAEAGLDGVEFVASHGMLMAQFLNPQTNHRTDQYGGSEENRFRFISECIAQTRHLIGTDKIIGLRISADEHEPDGIDAPAWLQICKRLNDNSELDFLDVTVGSMMGPGGSVHVVPPMQIEHAYTTPKAGAIKAVMDKTILVAGRINQPQLAEEVIAAGQADMCGMTRAMISDPEMPNKARNGQLGDIRACIGCNQACIGHYHMGVGISCIQNPLSGRELTLGPHTKTKKRKRVLVAGGGPAGMKAAAVAAQRGHSVCLCEASSQLGGQALLAQLLPGRSEFGAIVDNLHQEMTQADVQIRLNTPVDRAMIEKEQPDVVFIATGATPFHPKDELGMALSNDVHVVDAWQILRGEAVAGSKVVVADWRCDWIGLGVAEKLVLEGSTVRLCFDGETLGQNLQLYLRTHWAGVMHRLGVQTIPYARLFGTDSDTVYFHHNGSGEPIICEDVDTLILAQGHKPSTALEEALGGLNIEIHLIGDCLSPRTAEEAVYEGLMAARAV